MAATIAQIGSAIQKLATDIVTKIAADPLAYAMMGVPANKRLTAALYLVGFAVIYGFVMRLFFRAEEPLLSGEEPLLTTDDILSTPDDVLSMLGEMVGGAVDGVLNTADMVSEALGVKPKATKAAKQAARAAKQVSRQAAAVRRTAWWHHFLRGLIVGLLAWNAIAILAFPPKQDVLATYGLPEPSFTRQAGGAYSRFGRSIPPEYTWDSPSKPSPTPYVPYYRSASSTGAYKSSGVSWTPVSRCGR